MIDREDLEGNPNGFAIHVSDHPAILELVSTLILMFCVCIGRSVDQRWSYTNMVPASRIGARKEKLVDEIVARAHDRSMGKEGTIVHHSSFYSTCSNVMISCSVVYV